MRSPGREAPLEKAMATHSSTLAWRIPGTEGAGWTQSMGSQSQTPPRDEHVSFKRAEWSQPRDPKASTSLYLFFLLPYSLSCF